MITVFKKKKKISSLKNKVSSVFFIFIVLFVIGFVIVTNWRINKKREDLTQRISSLKGEIALLEERNRELKEKKTEIESEDYLEKVARNQLDLKKPGEEVIVIQKEGFFSAEASEDEKEQSWWDKIKNIFMK